MKKIEAIVGPIFCGKTHFLVGKIQEAETAGKSIVLVDPYNTRNSERDLSSYFPKYIRKENTFRELSKIPKDTIIIVDEVHLWDVFKNDELPSCLRYWSKNDYSVYIAGLLYDFYNGWIICHIWNQIWELCNFSHLPSRTPCAACGAKENVLYSRPTKLVLTNADRVGDHYENICFNCMGKSLGYTMEKSVDSSPRRHDME